MSRDFTFLTLDFTFLTLDFTFLTPQWCEQENEFGQTTTSWDVLCRSGSNFNFSKYKYPFESDETFLSQYGSHAYTEKPSVRAGRQPEQALEVSRWAWVPCLVKKVPSDSKGYLYFEKLKLEPDRHNTSHDVVVWPNSFSCSHHCGVKNVKSRVKNVKSRVKNVKSRDTRGNPNEIMVTQRTKMNIWISPHSIKINANILSDRYWFLQIRSPSRWTVIINVSHWL